MKGKLLWTWAKEEKYYYIWSLLRTTNKPIFTAAGNFPGLWVSVALESSLRQCTWAAKSMNHWGEGLREQDTDWGGKGLLFCGCLIATAVTEWACISTRELWQAVFSFNRWGMNLPSLMFSSPSKVLGLIIATPRMKKSFSSYRISRASSHWAGFM